MFVEVRDLGRLGSFQMFSSSQKSRRLSEKCAERRKTFSFEKTKNGRQTAGQQVYYIGDSLDAFNHTGLYHWNSVISI